MSDWRPVFDPYRGGYSQGFDRARELEFKRDGWNDTKLFKMGDQHPAFNVAGLYWREPRDEPDWPEFQ